MLDLDLFPGVIKEKKVSRIHGEVYDLDTQTLEQIDIYEGKWYTREDVKLEAGLMAQMYILREYPHNAGDIRIISRGIWTGSSARKYSNAE